jgi:hypothetical protein
MSREPLESEQRDWRPTYQERFPAWRSSDGSLKESESAIAKGMGKNGSRNGNREEALSGYESSEQERRSKDEPQKLWELSNAYGALAIGKNKKKQLVMVNSQRRTKSIRQLTPESKRLRRETSAKIPLISGEFRFNEDWNRREESAYTYQEDASRSPDYLMRKMRELLGQRTLKVQENISPFLDARDERKELNYLQEKAAELSRSRERVAERGLRDRIQFLTTVLADKERQMRKLYTKLPELLEEARKEETSGWAPLRSWVGEKEAAPDEDEDEDEDEGHGGGGNDGSLGKDEDIDGAGEDEGNGDSDDI